MKCWKCHSELPIKTIGFRDECETCGSYLHCCVNCLFYQPGLPNDCRVPGTDPIKDREHINFCEEFQPALLIEREKRTSLSAAEANLFGDAEPKGVPPPETPKERFDSLFKD